MAGSGTKSQNKVYFTLKPMLLTALQNMTYKW